MTEKTTDTIQIRKPRRPTKGTKKPSRKTTTQPIARVIWKFSALRASWSTKALRSLYISQMISDGRNHRMPPRCAKPAHWRVSASDSGTGAAPGAPGGPTGGGVGGLESDISLPFAEVRLAPYPRLGAG